MGIFKTAATTGRVQDCGVYRTKRHNGYVRCSDVCVNKYKRNYIKCHVTDTALDENRHTEELCPLYEDTEFKDKAPRFWICERKVK